MDPLTSERRSLSLPKVDLLIHEPLWQELPFDIPQHLSQCVACVTQHIGREPLAYELSVLLTHDTEIQTLNKNFRSKDKPTNSLSFPPHNQPPSFLGDLVLSYQTLNREAVEQEKSFFNHFTHLVVHGLLHLLGYDHVQETEATTMETLEVEILDVYFHIPNPYTDTP
jgi:probable rRNA maturation factor